MEQLDHPRPKARGGRPRSEAARKLILQTTLQMLQHQTVQAISIEAIAKAAGVSKATIYRWWTSKASIVIDAFVEHHVVRTPIRRDLPPAEALREHYKLLVEQYSQWPGRIVAQILAEAQYDPEIGREFRERFHYGRRAVIYEIMKEWRQSGGLRPDIKVETLMDVLYAPVYLRLMIGHLPLDEQFAVELPEFIFNLVSAPNP